MSLASPSMLNLALTQDHVQNRMQKMGMSSEKLRPDYILNEEEACDIALEFGFNPTVDDEAAFDLLPEYVDALYTCQD